jgi:hypothetical protein
MESGPGGIFFELDTRASRAFRNDETVLRCFLIAAYKQPPAGGLRVGVLMSPTSGGVDPLCVEAYYLLIRVLVYADKAHW